MRSANLVSILARAEARALLKGVDVHVDTCEFQSSPAPRRGRYFLTVVKPTEGDMFQSSPAPRRGRYQVVFMPVPRGNSVSILARAEARALPATCSPSSRASASFNPRPRRGAGATQDGRCPSPHPTRFNPRPRRGAGATLQRNLARMQAEMFQSSPAPRRGRYAQVA